MRYRPQWIIFSNSLNIRSKHTLIIGDFFEKLLIIFLMLSTFVLSISAIINSDSSYIVIETTTNRILEGNNLNKQYLVASTAKIMTAITAIENYKLDEEIKVTKEDVLEVGSKVYLKENEEAVKF